MLGRRNQSRGVRAATAACSRSWRASRSLLSMLSAISLVTLVGFSRIALGAHFLTDVLAAIFFGIIWLTLCMILGKPLRTRFQSPIEAIALPVGVELAVATVSEPKPAPAVTLSRQ